MATFTPEPPDVCRCTSCGVWTFGLLCAHCAPLYATVEAAA